jgi:hypothetical protein
MKDVTALLRKAVESWSDLRISRTCPAEITKGSMKFGRFDWNITVFDYANEEYFHVRARTLTAALQKLIDKGNE